MSFKLTEKHFCATSSIKERLKEELWQAEKGHDPRTQIYLESVEIECLSNFYPPVRCIRDLDLLPQKLTDGNEFAFSQLFDPKLVDACMIRGIFPLTICIGNDAFFFAPKLHNVRLICATVKDSQMRNEIKYFPPCNDNEGVFCLEQLHISKRFLRPTNDVLHSACFDIFVNRKEDLVDVFELIHRQHGENWVCEALRKCFFYMQSHEESFKSKIITIAVRRHKYQTDSRQSLPSSPDEVQEGDLVAAEIGYIVGGIYTSATGAYCVSGAGKLQLAVTGCILRGLGCKVWDLGMPIGYKISVLGCVKIEREMWTQMVKHHGQHSPLDEKKSKEFLLDLQRGKNVGDILKENAEHSEKQS